MVSSFRKKIVNKKAEVELFEQSASNTFIMLTSFVP